MTPVAHTKIANTTEATKTEIITPIPFFPSPRRSDDCNPTQSAAEQVALHHFASDFCNEGLEIRGLEQGVIEAPFRWLIIKMKNHPDDDLYQEFEKRLSKVGHLISESLIRTAVGTAEQESKYKLYGLLMTHAVFLKHVREKDAKYYLRQTLNEKKDMPEEIRAQLKNTMETLSQTIKKMRTDQQQLLHPRGLPIIVKSIPSKLIQIKLTALLSKTNKTLESNLRCTLKDFLFSQKKHLSEEIIKGAILIALENEKYELCTDLFAFAISEYYCSPHEYDGFFLNGVRKGQTGLVFNMLKGFPPSFEGLSKAIQAINTGRSRLSPSSQRNLYDVFIQKTASDSPINQLDFDGFIPKTESDSPTNELGW